MSPSAENVTQPDRYFFFHIPDVELLIDSETGHGCGPFVLVVCFASGDESD